MTGCLEIVYSYLFKLNREKTHHLTPPSTMARGPYHGSRLAPIDATSKLRTGQETRAGGEGVGEREMGEMVGNFFG